MAVRNYKQLSSFIKEISSRLLADQTLCKLLYYNDTNPLAHPDFTSEERSSLLGKEVRFIPRVGPQEVTKSKVVIVLPKGEKNPENKEVIVLPINIFIYTPFSEWVIEGDELRIFLIMSRIEELLDGKDIKGIGRLTSFDFELAITTDELSGYRLGFFVSVFS